MNRRNITQLILEALSDTPVVFLRGARQTGKTTLVQNLADEGESRGYVTLDSAPMLAMSLNDPAGFLRGLAKPLTLDEVQRSPGTILAIKEDVDRDRVSGRYLLTGSANILALPRVADSLAGRMEIFTLYPMSRGEISGAREDFISRVFDSGFVFTPPAEKYPAGKLIEAICGGGYPEALSRRSGRRRAAWFDSYVTSMVERDLRDIANVQDVGSMLRLLAVFAARTATLFNQSDVSRITGIPNTTLSRYIAMFEALFLVHFLPAWSSNLGKRLVKSPKLHVVDSGLAAHLCGMNEERLANDAMRVGSLLESFVVMELLKQTGWTDHPASLWHYRSHTGEEVDVILEDRAGFVAGVEVKLAATVSKNDMKPLAGLRDALGERFVRGVVLYGGDEIVPMGEGITALPIGTVFAPA